MSNASLFGQPLDHSVGALHDKLEREGLLRSDPHLEYLVYRLRRDVEIALGRPELAQRWQKRIETMEATHPLSPGRSPDSSVTPEPPKGTAP